MDNLFNAPNSIPSTGSKKPVKTSKPVSFIEAIREQGGSATKGVASNFIDQITGRDNSSQAQDTKLNQQPFNFAEYLKRRENKIRQQERMLIQQQQRSETVLFYKKEDEAKKEIESIKVEIKKIIISTKDVSSELIEAEKTVMTTTVEAGTYQINFFQRIKRLIAIAKKRITEAQSWLELFNQKKQQSFYWGQVKKTGTKYMLSSERQVVTQTG